MRCVRASSEEARLRFGNDPPQIVIGEVSVAHDAAASFGVAAGPYMSGLSSCRETPVMRSTSSTRSAGTRSHCERALGTIPSVSESRERRPRCSFSHEMSASMAALFSDTEFQST